MYTNDDSTSGQGSAPTSPKDKNPPSPRRLKKVQQPPAMIKNRRSLFSAEEATDSAPFSPRGSLFAESAAAEKSEHMRVNTLSGFPSYYFFADQGMIPSLHNLCLETETGEVIKIYYKNPRAARLGSKCGINVTPNTYSADVFVDDECTLRRVNVIFSQRNQYFPLESNDSLRKEYGARLPLLLNSYIKLGEDRRRQHIWWPLTDPRSTPDGTEDY